MPGFFVLIFRLGEQNMFIKSKNVRGNIIKDYMFCFLRYFDLTSGIWMLYLASKGLTLMEIGIIESLYHITSFTMEIPTGIVADLYGRKTSRVLGRLANVISVLLLLSNEMFFYVLSFIFAAIGNNLESGAGQALIYDSLKELKEEDTYMQISGRREIFYQVASSLALIIGGYLGTISYNYVYIVASVFSIITLLQAFTFIEPSIGKIEQDDNILRLFINQFVTSVNIIKNDFRIAFLIISVEIFSTFVTTEFFYIQNHFKLLGRNEFEIGIILSIGALVAAFLATKAYKIEARFGFRGVLTILPILAIGSFWGVAHIKITIISFISIISVDSILVVVISDYINRLIPSEQRATILSFQSMVFSLFMIILFPLVGKLGDNYGLMFAFRTVAIIASIVLIFIVVLVRLNNSMSLNEVVKD